jgi:hypothetical protein
MVERVGLSELHMDPPNPLLYTGAGHMLGKFGADAIDRFVDAAGPGSGSPLVSSEIRHLGGALLRPKPGNGALATFDADYLTFGVGIQRPRVPQLHRAPHRSGAVLRAARLPPAVRGEAGIRPTSHPGTG